MEKVECSFFCTAPPAETLDTAATGSSRMFAAKSFSDYEVRRKFQRPRGDSFRWDHNLEWREGARKGVNEKLKAEQGCRLQGITVNLEVFFILLLSAEVSTLWDSLGAGSPSCLQFPVSSNPTKPPGKGLASRWTSPCCRRCACSRPSLLAMIPLNRFNLNGSKPYLPWLDVSTGMNRFGWARL